MAGYQEVVAGTAGLSALANETWSKQVVMRFATAAARDTALATVKTAGMVTEQLDTGQVTTYNGTAWVVTGWFLAGGRVECRIAHAGALQSIGAGATANISWDTEYNDPYAFIGVPSATITVPVGLGGAYAISGAVSAASAMSGGGTASVTITPTTYPFYATPGNQSIAIAIPMVILNEGTTFGVAVYNGHSAALGFSAVLNLMRLAL